MAKHYSSLGLSGYRRLSELERAVWYSPVAIAIAIVGLVGAIFALWGISRGVTQFPPQLVFGYAAFLAAYGALFAYYHAYRFQRLSCPDCGERMQAFVSDLDDNSQEKDSQPKHSLPKMLARVRFGGRSYRPPYDEDDRRPWVRLMVHVRACQGCKTFVSCARVHFETCTPDELAEISRRVA